MPHLAAVGGRWGELAARDGYREGLRAFVDGLLPPPPTPPAATALPAPPAPPAPLA
ncbi:hypothetical protein [Streptomyces sp. NPDC012888]|uniref:hypothetical protein n=1 Tax=Streptomyces sp. NPDC012888 TaxID=3364855 RepID=UPI0036C24C16